MDVDRLEERIGALERKLARTRRLAAGAGLLLLAGLALAASSQAGGAVDTVRAREVVAERIELHGGDGERALVLQALRDGGSLELFERGRDHHASRAVSIGVDGGFGGGSIRLHGLDQDGSAREGVSLGVCSEGGRLDVGDWQAALGKRGASGTAIEGQSVFAGTVDSRFMWTTSLDVRSPERDPAKSADQALVRINGFGSCGAVRILTEKGDVVGYLGGDKDRGGKLSLFSSEPLVPPNNGGRPLVDVGSDGDGNGSVRTFSRESWDRIRKSMQH